MKRVYLHKIKHFRRNVLAAIGVQSSWGGLCTPARLTLFNHSLLQLISSLVGNTMCGKNGVVLVVPENLSRIPISRQQTSHFNSSFSQWQFTLQQFSITSPANRKCCEMIAANMLLYLWNSKTLRQFQLVNVFYYQAFKKSSVSRVFIWHDQALKEKY